MRFSFKILVVWALSACSSLPIPLTKALPHEVVAPTLSTLARTRALRAHTCARARGDVEGDVLSIIDFDLPSHVARLWVLDTSTGQVWHQGLVAHGQGSGGKTVHTFSNNSGSHQSSIGVYRTGEIYRGKHGRSLRLDGLEAGYNDNARARAIVMHGADYVSANFIRQNGRLGRSHGCPALPQDDIDAFIDAIHGGSLLVVHRSDANWLADSTYLHCAMVAPAQ
jgi:hypothetical protein